MLVVIYRLGSRNRILNVPASQLAELLAELTTIGAANIVVSR